jgi:hypothetical protein
MEKRILLVALLLSLFFLAASAVIVLDEFKLVPVGEPVAEAPQHLEAIRDAANEKYEHYITHEVRQGVVECRDMFEKKDKFENLCWDGANASKPDEDGKCPMGRKGSAIIRHYAGKYKIPLNLVRAIIATESSFRRDAANAEEKERCKDSNWCQAEGERRCDNATNGCTSAPNTDAPCANLDASCGLMQINKSTHFKSDSIINESNWREPAINISKGTKIYKDMYNKFSAKCSHFAGTKLRFGDFEVPWFVAGAVAMYNKGTAGCEGNWSNREHVGKVLAWYRLFSNPPEECGAVSKEEPQECDSILGCLAGIDKKFVEGILGQAAVEEVPSVGVEAEAPTTAEEPVAAG